MDISMLNMSNAIADFRFYTSILNILLVCYVVCNTFMWLRGLTEINIFRDAMEDSLNDFKQGKAETDREKEVLKIHSNSFQSITMNKLKFTFISNALGKFWLWMDTLLLIMILSTVIYGYFKVQSSLNIPLYQWNDIGKITVFLLIILALIPQIAYIGFANKFQEEVSFKIRCHQIIREQAISIEACYKILDKDSNDSKDNERLVDNKSNNQWRQSTLDRISLHQQSIRCYQFITDYIRALEIYCGDDITSPAFVNAYRYLRSQYKYSYYNRNNILRILIEEHVALNKLFNSNESDSSHTDDLKYISDILNGFYRKNLYDLSKVI